MTSLDRYAVMGNPIAHSQSPTIHRLFAEQTQQAMDYQAILVPEDAFNTAVNTFFQQGGKGLNVTVPFKLQAYTYVNELSERAKLAEAVNTLIRQPGGNIRGDNTDGVGMLCDITKNLGWTIVGETVLLLGAGGAVRGVLAPLLNQCPARLVIANRTLSKAQALVQLFQPLAPECEIVAADYTALQGQIFSRVINGTSASLAGDLPPLPADILSNDAACYDMMYAAEPTVFMQWALHHGAKYCADGLGMLVEQAAESFRLWRGLKPNTAPVIQALRQQLLTNH